MVPKKAIRGGGAIIPEAPKQVARKLVRDRIPEIVAKSGGNERYEIIHKDDRLLMLRAKLIEEVDEFLSAPTHVDKIAEAADLSEVVRAIVRASFLSPAEVERKRIAKKKARGGFTAFIALVRVT